MRLARGVRMWGLITVVAALVMLGLAVLGPWKIPLVWLAGSRRVMVGALGWARTHLLTVTVAGLLIGIAGLVAPFLVRRLERRDAADKERRTHDRAVMLKRIHNRWIKGVLDRSLTEEARIRLGLTRRPEVIAPPAMLIRRPRQAPDPLLAGIPISEVFTEIGGGLLILGAPGSGKTTALLELARDLLKDAEADQTHPIPVVFNLSSWAAKQPPLDEWLIDELHIRYDVARSLAERWVAGGEILPLLDGLDEVAKTHRARCVEAVNTFRQEHGPVQFAVCSRTEEYMEAASLLRVEEAVELQPPTRGQVSAYLAAAGSSLADVKSALDADETLWELLSCPLVLNIAALTYQDQPAAELRTPGTSAQRLERLFTAYTEQMLAHRPTDRYTPPRMRRWLAWLARSMQQRSQSEFHPDRLTPDWLPTKIQRRLAAVMPAIVAGPAIGLVVGLVVGLVYGLLIVLLDRLGGGWRVGVVYGLVVVLVSGLACGLVGGLEGLIAGLLLGQVFGLFFGLVAGVGKTNPVEEVHWSWIGLVAGVRAGRVFGVVFGLVQGLVFGLFLLVGPAIGLISGPDFGLVYVLSGALGGALLLGALSELFYGLIGGLATGLTDERSTPNEGIHRSARHALLFGLVGGLFFGLGFGLVGPVLGLIAGLVFAPLLALGFGGVPCLRHLAVRGLLAAHGFAPLRYVGFLNEATDRLFLRRAGSGYLFVHRLLLEYFASLETTDPPAGTTRPITPSRLPITSFDP
jgi:eukaryotic-like serine/threonine-protein kinase